MIRQRIACLRVRGPALAGPDPLRIMQTPNMTVVLYESGTFRQIFTDGRPLPKDIDADVDGLLGRPLGRRRRSSSTP